MGLAFLCLSSPQASSTGEANNFCILTDDKASCDSIIGSQGNDTYKRISLIDPLQASPILPYSPLDQNTTLYKLTITQSSLQTNSHLHLLIPINQHQPT